MKKLIFILFILTLLVISGCTQLQGEEISFIDMNNMTNKLICIGPNAYEQREFIINSYEEYQKLMDFKQNMGQICNENFELPEIDFSQNTLLGKFADGGGCGIDFIRNIYKNDANKKITYLIKVNEEGLCDMYASSMNWALIPKVPSDYEVEFTVK